MIIFSKIFIFLILSKKENSKATGLMFQVFPAVVNWVCVTSTGECLKTSDIWALPKTNSFRISGVDPIHLDILETPREIEHATKIENCQVCGQE